MRIITPSSVILFCFALWPVFGRDSVSHGSKSHCSPYRSCSAVPLPLSFPDNSRNPGSTRLSNRMGKKKRGHPDIEEILSRPWCYYCERDFDDRKVLLNHQRAKHFKCERCGRRLNTAGGEWHVRIYLGLVANRSGLSVHMSQVHKETLSAVDNALPNRAGLDIEIFGMEGVPEDIMQQHNQRVLTQFHQAEAERKAATGSTGGAGGTAIGSQAKKPKFESPSDLKKRLAEHKAKLAAEQANGGSSGGGTPLGAGANQSPAAVSRARQVSYHLYSFEQQVASPQYPQQQHFNGTPGSASFNFPPGYGQPPQQVPPFQSPGGPFPQQSSFSPPPFPNPAQYANPQFPPQVMQSSPPHFSGAPLGGPLSGPPRPFGAVSPAQQFTFQHQQPPRAHSPPQSGTIPQRSLSGSLPPAPGLPQRPAIGAPHVNHFQMQQMQQGQIAGPVN